MAPDSAAHHFWRVWAAPVGLAVVTVFGLLSALLGDVWIWKGLAWVSLLIPVVTAGWFARRKRRT
jgi:hypothetical protein